ncbi:hypothetical protein FRB97_000169 [Tulasnella sp. 331]|nr:hypothetical protein FRB97_000169 [Tulasnella sp. 331]
MLKSPAFSMLVASATIGAVNAFFKVQCSLPIVQEMIDPIINPGAVSGHLHTVHGGNNFGMDLRNVPTSRTYDTARESSCTSCQVAQDLSNYWVPTLYFKDPVAGTFTKVPNGGLLVYYLDRGDGDVLNGGKGLTAFPPGFRMLSGSSMKRSLQYPPGQGSQGELAERSLQGSCLRYTTSNPGYTFTGWPTTDCEAGMRAQLQFPSCWDGVNTYLAGNAHVQYLSGMDNGACTAAFPVYLPHLFFEVTWDIHSFVTSGQWNPATQPWPFVYSNGDPTGFGWHGDFYNGWDVPVLQNAIDHCNDPNNPDQLTAGLASACPYLNVTTSAAASACQIKDAEAPQPLGIQGPLAALPGCNPLQYGPCDATSYPVTNCPAVAPTCSGANVTTTSSTMSATTSAVSSTSVKAVTTSTVSMAIPTAQTSMSSTATMALTTKAAATTSKTSTASAVTVTSLPSNGTLSFVGCYTDQASPRTLSGYTFTDNTMTNALCSATCAAKGYMYAGSEYSNECYCGNSLGDATLSTWCNGPCAGDSTSICGGTYKLSVYKASGPSTTATTKTSVTTTTATTITTSAASASTTASLPSNGTLSFVGCYTDQASPRTLPGYTFTDNTMTNALCAATCAAKGYMYAGSEYSNECYCGNSLGDATLSTWCNGPCAGDSKSTCGGTYKLSVYKASGASTTATTAATTKSSVVTTSASTTTTTVPPTGSVASPPPNGTFVGCYTDDECSPILSGYTFTDDRMTNGLCATTCAAKGFMYAGTEFSNECYCGNSLGNATLSTSCTGTCAGDSTTMCGGTDELSVYKTSVAAARKHKRAHMQRFSRSL